MERVPSRELMDGLISTEDLQDVLNDLWRINRWYGGVSGNLKLLETFFARTGSHRVRILDVGAGDGRMAALLSRRMKERNIKAEFVAADLRFAHLRNNLSAGCKLRRIVADVFDLPFRPASFEVVICNLFVHHFSGDAAKEMIRAMALAASEAVLINDLERRWLPYLIIRHVPLLVRNRISRLDGTASVRQAYTRQELALLATEAKMGTVEMMRLPFFRNGLILWRTPVAHDDARERS